MKIKFLNDQNPFEAVGGTAFNDKGMIQKGIQRGHDIDVITPQNISLKGLDCDLVIFSNIVSFPRETIKEISSKYPYIFFHHDYNFCNHRLFMPMIDKCKSCINRNFWLPIYLNAKLHIWLSPLHREAYLHVYPELEKFRKVCIPSCMDVDLWKPVEGVERIPNSVIAVNSLAIFKGRYVVNHYVEQHPELHFTFVGSDPPLNLPNCTYLPYVKNEDLPKLYSAHEFFLHLPSQTEPYGRTSIEAMLTGCKIITNENNGAFSHPLFKEKNVEYIRKMLRQSSLAFWEETEAVMGEFELT